MVTKLKVLLCTGFHRSATSATANFIANAGLDMGSKLLGGGISNKGGHYEDQLAVNVHDQWLVENNTSWQFYDEVDLSVIEESLVSLRRYIVSRDSAAKAWGVKDPRACLFLPEWDRVLGERGHYLFILRHWSSCVESLLHRHSRELAFSTTDIVDPTHIVFWQSPTLAARMWLSYCKRILEFARAHPSKTLLATQRAMFHGQPLIETINAKFKFSLDESVESPYRLNWLRDHANDRLLEMLPHSLVLELDSVWQSLLALAELKHDDESPIWVNDSVENQQKSNVWWSSQSVLSQPEKDVVLLSNPIQSKLGATDLIGLLKMQANEDAISQQFDEALFKYKTIDSDSFLMVYDWCQLECQTSTKVNVALAYWLQKHQQWHLAIKVWNRCLTLKTVYPYMYHQLAQCYKAINDSQLAFYFANLATEKNPKNPNFLVFKATLLREASDIASALDCFEKAVEITADQPGIILPYCDLLEQEGYIEKAMSLNNKLLEAHPDNNSVLNMALRLTLKFNEQSADAMYSENMLKLLLALSAEERNLSLHTSLSNAGCLSSEKDLLSRVLMHWSSVGLDV
jgi:tetratricopeptide (TPR) repeat protein